jgi:hypothetical protein
MGIGTWTPTIIVVEYNFSTHFPPHWKRTSSCKLIKKKTTSYMILVKIGKCTCHNPSLGLATKARGCKVAGQVGDPGALHMFPGVQRVWGNEPSHSQVNSHVGNWSPKRTPESSEHDCRGQNSSPLRVFYIIGKLLKCRCLKRARMARLNI